MNERPILFSAPMIRALLAGRKSQTRRLVKPQPEGERGLIRMRGMGGFAASHVVAAVAAGGGFNPYGVPGDRLWVKETWATCTAKALRGHIHYRADGAVGRRVQTNGGDSWWSRSGYTLGPEADRSAVGVWVGPPAKWKPSIFMMRKHSRLTLEVTGVRVERLQAITEEDAKAEGVELPETEREEPDFSICPTCGGTGLFTDFNPVTYGARPDTDCTRCDTAAKRYRLLWESINGPDSWALNPWVWVIEFKAVTP